MNRLLAVLLPGVLVLVLGAAASVAVAAAADPAPALHALFAEEWEYTLREDPLFATSVGDNRYNDRLPSQSPADQARRAEHQRQALDRLHAIDRTRLAEPDRVSYDLFERELADDLAQFRF